MHLLTDIIRNSILITGLVVVMMMMIESLNIESKGLFFKGLRKTKVGQVIIGALLGSIPGCMGGFATVSLYTHRMFSFGALIAMMIASSGDEAFIMIAMIPEKALLIFTILFVVAVIAGLLTDMIRDRFHSRHCTKDDHSDCGDDTDCTDGYELHPEEMHTECCHSHSDCAADRPHQNEKEHVSAHHYGWKRLLMFFGLALFITALATGSLGHDHSVHTTDTAHIHSPECTHSTCESHGSDCNHHHHSEGHTFNLLSEDWMNVLFAGLSVIVLFVLLFASDHFIEEHLWDHIVRKHLPTIFAWTFGVLLIMGVGLQYVSIDRWISDNTVLMIILATLIGILPESGPHMIFVTLYAAGIVPLPVLLASCISQDGHSCLPLIAASRKSFLWAKAINCAVALLVGFSAYLIF